VVDVDSTSRFCLRTIQSVDVSWSQKSGSSERQLRRVSEICHVSVGFSFEKSQAQLESQHLKKV
jgi:hypothetical protein